MATLCQLSYRGVCLRLVDVRGHSRTFPDKGADVSRWERVTVELSSTWPGEAYLRFQAADGTAVMVAVDADALHKVGVLQNALGVPAERPDARDAYLPAEADPAWRADDAGGAASAP
jgi:hypothetical protein